MNLLLMQAITRLLAHLDGSVVADETDLMTDVEYLHDQACSFTGIHVPLDEDAMLDTLGQVAQRHADAGL